MNLDKQMDLDSLTKPELTDRALAIGAIKNKSAARGMKKQELVDAIKEATKVVDVPATADTLPAPPDEACSDPLHSAEACPLWQEGVPVGQVTKLLASAEPAEGGKVDMSALKALAEKVAPVQIHRREPVRRTTEEPRYAEAPVPPVVDMPVALHRGAEASDGPLTMVTQKQRETQPQDRLDIGASFRKASAADNLLPPVLPEAKRWGSGAWSKGEMRNAQARRRKKNQQRHKRTSRSAVPRASHAR